MDFTNEVSGDVQSQVPQKMLPLCHADPPPFPQEPRLVQHLIEPTFDEDDDEQDDEDDGEDVEAGLPHPEQPLHPFALLLLPGVDVIKLS